MDTKETKPEFTRNDFDPEFVFGCATSAYQVEGAHNADGKSMSNWDEFSLRKPYKIQDGSNACLAIDHYNRYKEDVMYIKKLGLDAYRLSLSWSRILPGGRLSCGVNKAGVKFYNDLIDFCLSQGIKPYVTIFHFDVPQCLEHEYGGFLDSKITVDFAEYAEVCFWEFGDRVKHWITLNEPWTFAHNGYVIGAFPPGHGTASLIELEDGSSCTPHRCPPEFVRRKVISGLNPFPGDAGTEPYIVAHNLILAHALAVDIYRSDFQHAQGGLIGITNMTTWYIPLDHTNKKDKEAARRAVDFMWGWFMRPIVYGDYPDVMKTNVGKRLPEFTRAEKQFIRGSYDFIGLNYYTTKYAFDAVIPEGTKPTYYTDQKLGYVDKKGDQLIGPIPGSSWLCIVPEGIYHLLKHTKDDYDNPTIYITEQGISTKTDPEKPVSAAALDDGIRATSYEDHLRHVKKAIDDGVKVKGYFLWSLFDNYEWGEGYCVRFGIYYVDFVNGLARYPKKSAKWWMRFLKKEKIKTSSSNTIKSNKRGNEPSSEENKAKSTKT